VVGPVQSGVGIPSEYFALEPRSYGVDVLATRKQRAPARIGPGPCARSACEVRTLRGPSRDPNGEGDEEQRQSSG
jgi:hypothetical protein